MKKTLHWILRIAGGGVALVIVLMTIAAIVVSRPSFQEKMVKQATEMLSEKLDTKVKIDSASISVFKGSVGLYGVEIDDRQHRKMLSIKLLEASLDLPALLTNRVVVKKAALQGLDALLLKPSKDEEANYQFVVDAFKSDKQKKEEGPKEKDTKKKGSKLKLDIDKVTIDDIHVKYNEHDISLKLARLNTGWLGKQEVKVEKVEARADTAFREGVKPYDVALSQLTGSKSGDDIELALNGLEAKWVSVSKKGPVSNSVSIAHLEGVMKGKVKQVGIDGLHFKTDNGLPRKNAGKPKKGFFDPGHLDITAHLKVDIDSLSKNMVAGRLTQCVATDSVTGFDIRDLHTAFRTDMKKIHFSDMVLQQKNTILNIAQAEMVLPSKKEGRRFSYTTGNITGTTQLRDIARPFAPVLKNFTLPLNLSLQMSGSDSAMAFRNVVITTDDKKLTISANGDMKNLKDKEKLDIRFNVGKMTAKGDVTRRIIDQFTVKKLMMKQLDNLGTITYHGQFAVVWKKEIFQGHLGTACGPLTVLFTIDDNTKYIHGQASSKALDLGKAMDMKGMGKIAATAQFSVDISKPRTALMRKQKGGKLPIGSVTAKVEDCSYQGIHVRNISATIESDGAVASGDIKQHGNYRDLSCSFSFTNTEEMNKIKITNPGIKFHKMSEEDKQAKKERKLQKKKEKEKAKALKEAEEEKNPKKKKKFLGLF